LDFCAPSILHVCVARPNAIGSAQEAHTRVTEPTHARIAGHVVSALARSRVRGADIPVTRLPASAVLARAGMHADGAASILPVLHAPNRRVQSAPRDGGLS